MKPINLLIIEDQERLLHVIRLGLTPLGYNITTAETAEEGLNLLLEKEFDLLLTDIRLPKMTGLELIYEIKRLNIFIPTLVMTAHADVDSAVKAMKQGVIDYIRKPFSIEDLDTALKQAYQHKPQETEPALPALHEGVEAKEKELIMKALSKTGNNRAKAAKLLKISERTLFYKLKKFDIV